MKLKLKPKGLRQPIWHVSLIYLDGSVGWLCVEGTETQLGRALKQQEPHAGLCALSVVRAR